MGQGNTWCSVCRSRLWAWSMTLTLTETVGQSKQRLPTNPRGETPYRRDSHTPISSSLHLFYFCSLISTVFFQSITLLPNSLFLCLISHMLYTFSLDEEHLPKVHDTKQTATESGCYECTVALKEFGHWSHEHFCVFAVYIHFILF